MGSAAAEPYIGDVANAYNDGPIESASSWGRSTRSNLLPRRRLNTGESLVHRHRTIHVQADAATLARWPRTPWASTSRLFADSCS